MTDDGIGRIDNIFGGTVILFQSVQFYLMVIFLKIQYIVDVGSAKTINTLRIISHHTNILKFIRTKPLRSGIVSDWYLDTHPRGCIENVPDIWPILEGAYSTTHWFSAKDLKIHGSGFKTTLYIFFINLPYLGRRDMVSASCSSGSL